MPDGMNTGRGRARTFGGPESGPLGDDHSPYGDGATHVANVLGPVEAEMYGQPKVGRSIGVNPSRAAVYALGLYTQLQASLIDAVDDGYGMGC